MAYVAGQPYEIQQSLNILAYGAYPPATGGVRDAPAAANSWAGTTGLDLIGALNFKNSGNKNAGLDFNAVCNALNSTSGSGREGQDVLSQLAGGPHSQ